MLLSISKIVGFDVRYLLNSGSWVVSRYLILTALGFITSIALARFTLPDTLGRYQLIISVIGIISLLALPGLNTAALKTVVDGKRGGIRQAFLLALKGSFVAVIILAITAFILTSHLDRGLFWGLLLSLMVLPLFWAPNHWYVFFEGRQDFAASSKRIILQQVVLFTGLMLVLFFAPSLPAMLLVTFAVPAAFNTIYYFEVLKREGISDGQVLDVRYGLACTLQKASSVIVEATQPLLIAATAGFASVAFYQVAYFLLTTMGTFFVNISTIYFPKLISVKRIPHGKVAFYHILSGIMLAIAYWVFVKYCFSFIYGNAYSDSKKIAFWLLPAVILMPLRVYWTNYFTLKQKNKIPIIASIIATLSAALVYLWFADQTFIFRSIAFILSLQVTLFFSLGWAYLRDVARKED